MSDDNGSRPSSGNKKKNNAELKSQFELFSKFGDKASDGKTIKLSQSDKWFKQAKIFDKKISTTDSAIAFRKISKNTQKLSFGGWMEFLKEFSSHTQTELEDNERKLIECGKPGLSSGTTLASNKGVTGRLAEESNYVGMAKNRLAERDNKAPKKTSGTWR